MKILKVVVLTIIFLLIFHTAFGCSNAYTKSIENEMVVTKFTESIEEFNNPDRGIYRPTGVRLSANSNWWNNKINYPNGLVHLRIGIKNFKDTDITADIVNKLNIWIQQVRDAGGTAIIRFAYDDFEGVANLEPSIERIEKHIEQLKPFFVANEDIIACVETGFLGPWGEQHTSSIVNAENIKKVTDKLLEAVPSSRTISVRRPLYYCYATGNSIGNIDKNISTKGTSAYRIGVFNDGYLGSKTDLGTFSNRQKELNWLKNQAKHTLYGGEVVYGVQNEFDENGNLFNSPEHVQEEMFITHTSYLNEEWNNKVIKNWNDTKYAGEDQLYKNSSVYTYVKNHLGYRFVLNESKITKIASQNENILIQLNLKNVGAGNVVNEKKAYIVLKNDENEYNIKTNIDVRNWNSNSVQNLDLKLLAENIDIGTYDVYLKIISATDDYNTNMRTIRFANTNVWNEKIGANKIGSVEITREVGDIDEDNKISINDLAILKLHLIGKKDIDNKKVNLADLDGDGKISINDLARLKAKLINM